MAAGVKPPALLPNYLAPEQILGEPFDARSDLFSVGVILYELLAGKYPFQVEASLIPREIVHSEPESLRRLDPQIPEDLERLLSRALTKNREQRLSSAAEFAAGLNNIAQTVRDSRTAPGPVTAVYSIPVAPPPVAAKPGPSIVPAPKPPAVLPVAPTPPPAPAVVMAALPVQPVPVAAQPALAAIKTAAQAVPGKAIPAAAIALSRKRMIPIAIGGLLAIGVFGLLLSRSSSQASQKNQAPAAQTSSGAPSTPAPAVQISVPVPVETTQPQPTPPAPAATPLVEVKPAPEVILRGQVKSLWEAGKYAQALGLVEEILADNPTHPEARAWKKKIRAAQDAEAAIK
jgi:serine/threonine-protein kinase